MSTYENNGYTDYYYLGSQLVAKFPDPRTQSDKPGYTGHVEDNDLQLTYMQQRYYDPLIGRFYSNDPVGFTASNPMMFNRYAYANNNPYKFVDPDGMYARGSGWKDEDWNKFDAAQKQTASDMSKTATSLRNEATGLKEGQTNANGYSASELNSMAGRLEQAATALNDNGSKGYFANAVSSFDNPHQYGDAVFGGKIITMSTEHYSFQDSNPARLQWNIGHEALHNAGMAHPIFQGSTPYRYGDFFQQKSFENLPANLRSTNPDYVLKQVYP